MARRLTSSDWDAVLGSSSLRRISDSKPWGREKQKSVSWSDGQQVKVGERLSHKLDHNCPLRPLSQFLKRQLLSDLSLVPLPSLQSAVSVV